MKILSCKYTIILFLVLVFNKNLAQESNKKETKSLNSKTDTIKVSSNKLEDILEYKAQEIRSNIPEKVSYLIEKAFVNYQDLKINADYLTIDWNTGDVYGRGKIDSTGKIIEKVTFEQAKKIYEYQDFKFNFKTKKGMAFGVRTDEGEGVIVAEKTKKANDSTFYMRRGFYTTDTYFKEKKDSVADYHLQTGKIKYINQGSVITGPIQMYIEQVPTPLVMPFFFLPKLAENRSAGILIPAFGEREAQGFYLQGLGFYTPIGENFDLTLRANLFTKGSWELNANTIYNKRYKFRGNFSASYANNILGIKGLSGYSKNTLYQIAWSHQQDGKASATWNFSSNVNFMSSRFFTAGLNNNNILNRNVLNNTANSSISLSKKFANTPFNAGLTLTHSQNNTTRLYNFTLPQLTVTMDRIYPFAPKTGQKKGLLQNLNVNYNMNLQNSLSSVQEEDLFKAGMFKNAQNGLQHRLNFATNQTIFNYFNLTFGADYTDVGVFKTIRKSFNQTTNQDVIDEVSGFRTFRTFGFNSSVQTQLFGMMQFKKGKKIEAIRHVMTPSIGYSLRPDFSTEFWNYYGTYNKNGKEERYSFFERSIFGSPGNTLSSSIDFSLSNNLEMKVRGSKKDSLTTKKVKLFDNLSATTSYNIAAKEFRLSPININGATSFLDSKVRVNFLATLNPYKIDEVNNVRQFVDELGSLTLTNYNISATFALNRETFNKNKKKIDELYKTKGSIRNEVFYFDNENYAHFDQKWNMDFNLIYNYNKDIAGTSQASESTASVRVNAAFSPSPYWTISGGTNYDLTNKKLAFTTFAFTRDLRSFNINFSWVPFGVYKTWNFFIGIKANILRDAVKYEERNFNSGGSF